MSYRMTPEEQMAADPDNLFGRALVAVIGMACHHSENLPRQPHEDDMDATFRVLVEALAMSLWLYAEKTEAPAKNHALMLDGIIERLREDTASLKEARA